LTISRLSRWSINYYNDTANQAQAAAMDRQAAGGGLGEYYSESDTRVPTWLVAGDAVAVGELTGLGAGALHGGFADTTVAARWLDDGIAPNGASGRVFTAGSVHGFDPTFAAPKSVSLLRALTDDIGEKAMFVAHQKGIDAALAYLHEHAGYTRVHNRVSGNKDLQRLPGLVGIACSTATTNAAPTAPKPGAGTPPKPATATPPTNASPPPASMPLSANAAASAVAIRVTVSNFKTRNGCSRAGGQRRLRSLYRGGYRPLTLPSAATKPGDSSCEPYQLSRVHQQHVVRSFFTGIKLSAVEATPWRAVRFSDSGHAD